MCLAHMWWAACAIVEGMDDRATAAPGGRRGARPCTCLVASGARPPRCCGWRRCVMVPVPKHNPAEEGHMVCTPVKKCVPAGHAKHHKACSSTQLPAAAGEAHAPSNTHPLGCCAAPCRFVMVSTLTDMLAPWSFVEVRMRAGVSAARPTSKQLWGGMLVLRAVHEAAPPVTR